MDLVIQQPADHKVAIGENTLIWAIACSLLLHVLIIAMLPNIKFNAAKKPDVLTIELVPPVKLVPPPVLAPKKQAEPITPPKPVEKKPAKPSPKPLAKPVAKPVNPKPIQIPIVEPTFHEPVRETQPQVLTSSPKAETTPAFTTPVSNPEPPKPTAPSEIDLNAARGQYADMLRREVVKDKKYPSIASRRGYQGEVVLEVKLDSNGNVLSVNIKTSSSFESLDNEAMAKIRRIAPFPLPPEALRGRTFSVTVPISFKLE